MRPKKPQTNYQKPQEFLICNPCVNPRIFAVSTKIDQQTFTST